MAFIGPRTSDSLRLDLLAWVSSGSFTMSIETVGLFPVLLSYRPCCCLLCAITTPSELAGLILLTSILPCNLSSASPLPRPEILSPPCTGAFSGLLLSLPMQCSSTWYAGNNPSIRILTHTHPGRNPDGLHRGRRGGVEQGSARNRRGPGVRDRGDARQARHRQPRAL